MKKYAYIIGRTDGSFEMVETDNPRLTLDVLHSAIGDCVLEVVNPPYVVPEWSDLRIVCDDNGLYKNLPLNLVATSVYSLGRKPVVGDVVYCRFSLDDEFCPDVSAFLREDANRLMDILPKEVG